MVRIQLSSFILISSSVFNSSPTSKIFRNCKTSQVAKRHLAMSYLTPRKLNKSKFFKNLSDRAFRRTTIFSILTRCNLHQISPRQLKRVLPYLTNLQIMYISFMVKSNFLKKLKVTKSTRKLKIYSMPRLVQIQRELSIRAVGYEHKSLKSSTTLKNSLTTQLDHQHVYDSIRLRYYDFPNTTLTTVTRLYSFLSRKSLRFVRSRANQLIGLGSNLVSSWLEFVSLYVHIGITPRTEIYIQARKMKPIEITHNLYMRFNQHRLIVALADNKTRRTHFFLSTGLLLKYFQGRKAIKKNKAMKLLMIRFLRKILILLRLRNIVLMVRGVPLYLELLLSMLFKPLSHLFIDPFTGELIDEIQKTKNYLNFSTVIFTRPKPFGYQKTKKRGRVKRKIRRKLVKVNSVID